MSDLFWFSDSQWAHIELLLPSNTRSLKRVNDRRVLSGIVHFVRSNSRWIDAPTELGFNKILYSRFQRWAERGIGEDVPDLLMIDSTIVKAH